MGFRSAHFGTWGAPPDAVAFTALLVGLGLAVAIEPMTAAPNALNTGLGLRWLEPDENWVVRWGIRYTA